MQEANHFDPTIPRFFSHKIPRTRDGSLDFGRSKPVDYSFLDYSNPNIHEREAALHNSLKRPSSAHTSSETMAKLVRHSPPHDFLANKHRLAEAVNLAKHPGRNETNPYEDKWRVLEGSEKRFCSICNKDAQYLCSGCRKVWYCSRECQVRFR
jgi:MYND finger.